MFMISCQPHIFSNGFQIRFNEEPCPECNIGYIVPEWVEENPSLSDLQSIFGPSASIPTTTIILPLKSEKVMAVKQQLSHMHPEVLLFLSKIKRLSVREHNDDPRLNTVTEISITSETDFQMRKNINAESFSIHLATQEKVDGEENECSYYMWRQKFPVKSESRVSKRKEINEWVITLAFPVGQRLNRGLGSPGVYAFLPTEMVTNLPFIMQADFLLASSRESMLLDSPWNIGILSCVPTAFVNAFLSLLKSTESAPSFSLPPMFKFLPVNSSPIPLLDSIRLSIKDKLVAQDIIPCESYTNQKLFCKPNDVRRLLPDFWDILAKAQKLGVNLTNLSSHGTCVLSSSFDTGEYDKVLEFLGVQYVDAEWYGKCIAASRLAWEVSELVYLELLCFVADNWNGHFARSNIQSVPLIRYENTNGMMDLWSVYRATQHTERVCIVTDDNSTSWLINWNREFASITNRFFVPKNTQMMMRSFSKRGTLKDWLNKFVKVEVLNVYDYALLLLGAISNRKDVIALTHFLYHSLENQWLSDSSIKTLCRSLPLVDTYGNVTSQRTETLVPAKGSKWVGLMGSNPWRMEKYVVLGADYLSAGCYAGEYTPENQLLSFLQANLEVSDIPKLRPPDAAFSTVSSPLTKENAYLLLEWIQNLRYRGINLPPKFLNCLKFGSWLRTSVGHKSPSESFLSSLDWGNLLQMESVLVDIPMIDQGFYGCKITEYKEELRLIGVRFEFGEASSYIGEQLMAMAANSILTRQNVFSLLKLIRFLREKQLSPEQLVKSIKDGRWLKIAHQYRSPVGSIMFSAEWTTASCISNLPFIDTGFYGEDILNFKEELEILGVVASFKYNHQLLVDNFKLSTTYLPADAAILILECLRYAGSIDGLIRKIREIKWLKTHFGYQSPIDTFLADSEWQCFVEVVDDIPLIDEEFYSGRIRTYTEELKKVGVVIRAEDASKAIAHRFKKITSSSFLRKKNVIALLGCYKKLKERQSSFPPDLINCIHNEKWLCTRLGFKLCKESILFDPQWDHLSSIAALPFIDDSDLYYGKEIYDYKDELKALGVIVDFEMGAKFLSTCLNIPTDPSALTPLTVLFLLKAIKNFKKSKTDSLPEEFMKRIGRKWLRTSMGYMSPSECILYDTKWGKFLQLADGPFIDEAFYGSEVISFRDELKEIGVVVDVEYGCSLLAQHLKDHSDISVLTRVFMYLSDHKWKPDNEEADWIWIPFGSNKGKWVGSDCCVLHDNDNLFGSMLYVLENHYDTKLLSFFSVVLGVKHNPTIRDYSNLWKVWETASHPPSMAEFSAFWVYIAKHWSKITKKLLKEIITKLPVYKGCEISLIDKQDVFIPDDLLLEDLFGRASQDSVFVWYPDTKLPETSRAKMNVIFSDIGVRKISEAVQKEDCFLSKDTFRKADARSLLLKDGLFKIILGFLAGPSCDMCWEKRQRVVSYFCDLEVLETDGSVTASYSLALTSGKVLAVKATQMFRWERENSKLYMQNINISCGKKSKLEFATYFSEVIAQGLLFENEGEVSALAELIRMGCLVDFDSDAVEFLLKTRNLQLFAEDEEFLESAFSSLMV